MQASEGLGLIGWAVLGLVLLEVVVALLFGFSKVFWFALILTIVAFVLLLNLCRAKMSSS